MSEQSDRLPPLLVLAGLAVPLVVALLVLLLEPSFVPQAPSPPTPRPSKTPRPTVTFTPLPSASASPTWTPLPTFTFTPSPTPTPSSTPEPTFTFTPTPYRDPLLVAPALNLNDIVPWDGSRTVTVLLMGVDRRPGQGGRTRTDTMLVVRFNPAENAAGIVSVPRDLFVNIPGYGSRRINSAYVYGGGDLARRTVEGALGIDVDYYSVVDFVAFVTIIDEMGGVDVYVEHEISDVTYPDHYYGYEPLYIPAGMQHMDGTMALTYARSRHGSSDFERASRQQRLLMALRDKAVDFNALPNLLRRAPGLSQILSSSVDTDMPLEQIVSVALAASNVPSSAIETAVIDGDYVVPITLYDGAQVLWPVEERIHALVEDTLP